MTTKIVVFGTDSISMQVRQTMMKLFSKNISKYFSCNTRPLSSNFIYFFMQRHHRTTYVLHLHCTHRDYRVHKLSEEKKHSIPTHVASFASMRTDFVMMLIKPSVIQFSFCHSVIKGTETLAI